MSSEDTSRAIPPLRFSGISPASQEKLESFLSPNSPRSEMPRTNCFSGAAFPLCHRRRFSFLPPLSTTTPSTSLSAAFWKGILYISIMRASSGLLSGLRALNHSLSRTAIARTSSRPFSQSALNRPSTSSTYPQRPLQRLPAVPFSAVRYNSSSSSSSSGERPLTNHQTIAQTDAQNEEQNRLRREQEPAYQITFTCKPCGNRASHRMSKHGYHKGTVLIRCPSCHNRHVISDHLNIFFDKKTTLEDILKQDGRQVTRGYLEGDMEFWDDGVAFKREEGQDESKSRSDSGSDSG